MSKRKLKRKGRIVRENDRYILINEMDEKFQVNDFIAYVWLKSEGLSVDELTDLIIDVIGREDLNKDLIKRDVYVVVEKLMEMGLIE